MVLGTPGHGKGQDRLRANSTYGPILVPVLIPSWLLAVALGAIMPVLALAALSIGAETSYAAVLVGIMGAVSLIGTIPAGIFIDRVGDTAAMVSAGLTAVVVLGTIAVTLALDLQGSLVIYTVCLMLMAPVTDVWSLARQALVAESVPPSKVALAMTALGGTQRVGNLIGPLLGAALMLVAPIWSVFLLAAVAAAAATVVVCLPAGRALDAPHPSRRRVRSPMPDGRGSAAAETSGIAETGGPRPALRQLQVRWSAVVLVGVSITTLTVARAGQPIIVQLWGVHLGLHSSAISSLIALGAAVELGFMFLGGYLKERWGRAAILVTCLAVFGVGFLVMVWWQHLIGMVIAVLVMALGNGLGAGVNMTIGADLSPSVGRARFLGVWAMFNNIGRLGGPALTSFLIAAASLATGIAVTGVIALAGAAWMCAVAGHVGLPGPARSRRP